LITSPEWLVGACRRAVAWPLLACLLGATALAYGAVPEPAKVAPVKTQPAKSASVKTPPPKTALSSRKETKIKASQMAAGVRAAEAALSPAELAIAQRVELGDVACELNVTVSVRADAKAPGYFDVQSKKFRFRMVPVVSSTGAIRLEDVRAGAVWLQLANKSMLMNQKTGSRLADACVTPAQLTVARAMETATTPGLLDGPATPPITPPAVVPAVVSPEVPDGAAPAAVPAASAVL